VLFYLHRSNFSSSEMESERFVLAAVLRTASLNMVPVRMINRLLAMKGKSVRSILMAVLCSTMLLSSCHKKRHRMAPVASAPRPHQAKEKPKAVPIGHTEVGIASWYGIPYHGRPAADGEIYNMETMVAAHRVLPFNTWLRVTNLANDKTVDVRVIDRGPFVGNRIIDLSKAAARQIGLLGPGIGKVRLEVISAPADVPANDFYGVQVGAFSVLSNAQRAQADYAKRYGTAELALKDGRVPLWRVIVGKESSLEAAQVLASRIQPVGKTVFVVRLDKSDTVSTSSAGASAE
jgi:rare lipoprotein A